MSTVEGNGGVFVADPALSSKGNAVTAVEARLGVPGVAPMDAPTILAEVFNALTGEGLDEGIAPGIGIRSNVGSCIVASGC